MRNIYFILRHGETTYQTKKKGMMYSWPESIPIKLTKKGEKQIKAIAKKLKKTRIDLIYSSDIFRARQTAEIVANELSLKVIFDSRLRDINLGIYHGGSKKEFYREFPDPKKRFSKRPKGGESWSDCKKRMLNFIREIDKKYKNKKILIVGHGDPLWLLEGAMKGLSETELLKQIFEKKYIKVGELRKLCK